MKLNHERIPALAKFTKFEKVNSFSYLIEHINNIGLKRGNRDYDSLKIKGDLFEVFVEFLIKRNGLSNHINIGEYEPADGAGDYGVDGFGKAGDGKIATVQVKYRHDSNIGIKYDETAKFYMQSKELYKVEDNRNMLMVTSAKRWNKHSKTQAGDRGMRILGRDQIENLIGVENINFWNEFRSAFNEASKKTRLKLNRREHQKGALAAFISNDTKRSQVLMPTGAGKTIVEHDIVNHVLKSGRKIAIVCAPRIVLLSNLKTSFWAVKESNWIYRVFSSDAQDSVEGYENDILRDLNPTTSKKEIKDEIKNVFSRDDDASLVLFSTYHSVHKIGEVLKELDMEADIVCCDEAHNLVRTDWRKLLTKDMIPAKKTVFFTATQKVAVKHNEFGMDNEDYFGPVIYQVEPVAMINQGMIVPPRIIYVDVQRTEKDIEATIIARVIRYFKHHERADKDCRLIVSCKSAQQAHELAESEHLKRALPEFNLDAITSLEERMRGKSRNEIFSDYANNKNAILFQYDIISEGVDLPGTTGVIPMRSLPAIKTVQTVGRALRIVPADRKALLEGRIKVGDEAGWEKAFGYVVAYSINDDPETTIFREQLEAIVYDLREQGYDFGIDVVSIEDTSTGSIDTEVPNYSNKKREAVLGQLENRIDIKMEDEEKAYSPISVKPSKSLDLVNKNILEKEIDILNSNE